jgi:hypothetical protein
MFRGGLGDAASVIAGRTLITQRNCDSSECQCVCDGKRGVAGTAGDDAELECGRKDLSARYEMRTPRDALGSHRIQFLDFNLVSILILGLHVAYV